MFDFNCSGCFSEDSCRNAAFSSFHCLPVRSQGPTSQTLCQSTRPLASGQAGSRHSRTSPSPPERIQSCQSADCSQYHYTNSKTNVIERVHEIYAVLYLEYMIVLVFIRVVSSFVDQRFLRDQREDFLHAVFGIRSHLLANYIHRNKQVIEAYQIS